MAAFFGQFPANFRFPGALFSGMMCIGMMCSDIICSGVMLIKCVV